MLFVALAILALDGPPVLFTQTRIGKGMRPFRIFKFRSMRPSRPGDHSLTRGADDRVTRLGRLLRRSHLDELPQLLNILLGQMSFIGPRPEIPEFVDVDDPLQREVLRVRPGLVDRASLHWVDEASVLGQLEDWRRYYREVILPDKLTRSLRGIHERSLKNDLVLLLETIAVIFKPAGRHQ